MGVIPCHVKMLQLEPILAEKLHQEKKKQTLKLHYTSVKKLSEKNQCKLNLVQLNFLLTYPSF